MVVSDWQGWYNLTVKMEAIGRNHRQQYEHEY